MLTPEERQRIEDEERKRHAEEQYRAEVRARLQQPSTEVPAHVKSNRIGWMVGISAVLVIGSAVIISISSGNQTRASSNGAPVAPTAAEVTPVPKTRYIPVNQKIASGQILVKASGYVQYRITITPDMVEPMVTGNFNASGGTGNDITAVIADEMNYTNWINGHQARVFWGTEGKQTTGTFEVRLRPGTYYLVFSNKFSAFTDKQVFLQVDLSSKRSETYY